jgi:superfamily II DNA helicase RecQ
VDLLYSIIDFAQESGRAGRVGEDIDSIIIIEEGKVERVLSSYKGGLDEKIIYEFITIKECRRRVMSLYLDNKEIEYGSDTNIAKCDGCGEGLTALERSYVRVATER